MNNNTFEAAVARDWALFKGNFEIKVEYLKLNISAFTPQKLIEGSKYFDNK